MQLINLVPWFAMKISFIFITKLIKERLELGECAKHL